MKIRGAIFDMDGTLLDSLTFWEHFWERTGERYLGREGFRPPEDLDRRVRTMLYADAMRAVHRECGISSPCEEFLAYAKEALSDFYRTVARPKAGAVALLSTLCERGIPLCLASASAPEEVGFVLCHHGLAPYFSEVLSCTEVGVGKDRPDIYLLAAERLRLSPSDVAVVEDSYVALETARRAGFRTVGVYDRNNYGWDRLRAAADRYLPEGEPLDTLLAFFAE
ncbi:MAG: HAD family phosphatase [Clostridia bacterium]|nr:HAD family phosphatase [Clostridia bacterium]